MQKKFDWRGLIVAALAALTAFMGAYIGNPPHVGGTPGGTPPSQQQPPTATPPQPASDPRSAIGKVSMSGGYCSATVVNGQNADGSYTLVCASHCFKQVGEECSFTLRDGRTVKATCIALDRTPDISILRTAPVSTTLPFIRVATKTPDVGSKVLQAGFGIDQPGNTEYGTVVNGPNSDGQVEYHLSVSPGDSGGGICLDSAGELLSPVCCTTNLGAPGSVWGGSPEQVNRMLKNPTEFMGVPPIHMPEPPAKK